MAYTYNLSIDVVDTIDSNNIPGLIATLAPAATAALTPTNFIIMKFNGATSNFDVLTATTDYTVAAGATTTTATINFTTALKSTDYLLLQVTETVGETTSTSQRLAVDPALALASKTSKSTYLYPTQSGLYNFALDNVNGTDFSAVESSDITLTNAPTTANSSIIVNKPYLVKFTGQKETVTISLNNATNDVADGDYEVSFGLKSK